MLRLIFLCVCVCVLISPTELQSFRNNDKLMNYLRRCNWVYAKKKEFAQVCDRAQSGQDIFTVCNNFFFLLLQDEHSL